MLFVSAGERLFNPDPAAYLPHRYPFLQLDRICALEPGRHAVAVRLVTTTEGFPPVLMIECVAQLAGVVVVQQDDGGGFLASINHADFFGFPTAGDVLTVTATMVKSFGRLYMIEGDVSRGDEQLLSVQLTLGSGKL